MTNFKDVLPPPQSDLANEIMRDPYNFGSLPSPREIEAEFKSGESQAKQSTSDRGK